MDPARGARVDRADRRAARRRLRRVPPADPAPRRRPRRILDGPLRRDVLVRPDALPLIAATARAGTGTDRRPRDVAGARPAPASSSIDTPRRVPILGWMSSFRSLVGCRSRSRMLHALAFVTLAVAAAAPVRAGEPPAFATAGTGDGKPAPAHTHTWVKQTQKEWVPPETQKVQVGVDA